MRVVVASGHMTDLPDRSAPRFPESTVWRVRAEIERQLKVWDLGAGDVLLCGGARGADLLAAEAALARGASVRLMLARPVRDFVQSSIATPQYDWADVFEKVRRHALTTLTTLDSSPFATADGNVYAAANSWMLDVAMRETTEEHRYGLLVWDGAEGDGDGGTDHMARLLREQRVELYGIDPSPRPSADRQWAPGKKKLLALDGGGIRGILTLGVLWHIEDRLRQRADDEHLVLADYFDYIAGTSTGAIIASALALGTPVDELIVKYQQLGKVVFKKRPPLGWWESLHGDEPLLRALDDVLPSGMTLGDARLRSLLTIVLHRIDTDSPWPLSNCPSAKYNRPERVLANGGDRNLDLSLKHLVRGSTAAPWFFPQERIKVGSKRVPFQDGGVTAYNNPAALLFMMATQPEYGVGWATGDDRLLLVSVGTGNAPVLAEDTNFVGKRLGSLPGVFMNASSVSQDHLCRVMGSTQFGPPIDNEVGTVAHGNRLFTYNRYNLDLGKDDDWYLDRFDKAELPPDDIKTYRSLMSIDGKDMAKMNVLKHFKDLRDLGDLVGRLVDIDKHFKGF